MKEFKNYPLIDFSLEEERKRFKNALENIFKEIGTAPYEITPLVYSPGLKLDYKALEQSINFLPENQTQSYSVTYEGDKTLCNEAIEGLNKAKDKWAESNVEVRAEILEKAAYLMAERKYELSATMVLEAGKPWHEADADTAEAIDFCNYYAQEARKLFEIKKMGDFQGESNLYFYEPRGINLIICPWNFPLAIPCGMFSASIVTGNCAILKPAEQTPVIAKMLFDIFIEAGLPKEVVAFIPGRGEIVGDYLSRHKKISTIVFTGSKEVGLNLIEIGGTTFPGQTHVKKVIAEMGGKNAIVIDSDADIDEAIKGVLYSAFGFQGQKCSACSRVYVVSNTTFNIFISRFNEAVKDLKIGPVSDPTYFAGPVITKESQERINEIINQTAREYPYSVQTTMDSEVQKHGNFVLPTVFTNIPDNHKIMTQEIFGPVVAINPVKTFAEGISKAINSEYRLTGGIFSRSPGNINYAIKNFKVGNLYINRSCTGALVYRQPFGGAYMSGVGSKAGGPDYLIQFVVPRAVSENTMRRGFAPE